MNGVSPEDIILSEAWWDSLSINQMRELCRQHCPYATDADVVCPTIYNTYTMWVFEGKPDPQQTIPVEQS